MTRALWVTLCVCCGSPALAADFGPTDTLIAGLPASAAALSATLVEMGTGNDTPARLALHGMAIRIGQTGTEARRMAFATALEAASERPGVGPDVKGFLREQLVWSRAIVPTIRRPGGAIDRTPDAVEIDAPDSATGFDGAQARAERFWVIAGRAQEGPGGRAFAIGWYREFWNARPAAPGHLRCAALTGMTDLDPDGSLRYIREGLLDDQPDVAACAERLAAGMPGPAATKAWIDLAANRREDADLRAVAVRILGRRCDPAALAGVRQALGDPHEDIRVAALGAIGALGGAKAVPDLIGRLGRTWTGEAATAAAALQALGDAGVAAALGAGYAAAPPAGRIGILGALAARVATDQLAVALRAMDDPDEAVAAAGCAAAGVLGGRDQLGGLVERVAAAADAARRDGAAGAFVAIVKRLPDPGEAADLVVDRLPDAVGPVRAALLSLLPKVGGADALQAARADLAHADPAVREAAVRALAEWSEPEPLPDLLELACSAGDRTHRILAVRGAVKLAEKLDLPAGQRAGRLADLYGLAPTTAERRLALAGLGRTPHPLALRVARFAMRDPAVAGEAQSAVAAIAWSISPWRPAEAREGLDAVLAAKPAQGVAKRAKAAVEGLKAGANHLTAWEVSNPYGREGVEDEQLLDLAFEPEMKPAKAIWRPLTRDDEQDEPFHLDIRHHFDEDHKAAYLRTTVTVPKKGRYRLEVGSDDGVKVWLDGRVVHTNNAWRGVECGEDKVPVRLAAGRHDLLLKVVNGEGGWGACVALRTASGKPVPGLICEIDLP